jgi:hypothetical protein
MLTTHFNPLIPMTPKHLSSAIATFSILTSSVLGNILVATTQPMPAVAQSVCNAIRYVNFSGKAASTGVNIRSGPSLSASIVRRSQPNEAFNFGAWTYGDVVNDIWTNQADARWYKLSGQDAWVASAVVAGNAPGSTPLCSNGQPDFTQPLYRQQNPFWNAGYAPISTNPPNPKLGNAKGNCTWYANGRTKQLGRNSARVDVMLGNANQWDDQARAAGISLSRTPQVGAIAQWEGNSSNPYGHVAVVEQVNPDGTILISESSYSPVSGSSWDFLYRTRTIPANVPSTFILP